MHKLSNKKRVGFFLLLGVAIYFLSGAVDELRVYQGATVAVYAVGIASIILLTGYSGQVSLGQGALLAIGGYAAALMRIHYSAPVWLCFSAAILVAALAGALLGLAAARLSGPYLAGTTLALAVGLPSIANQFGLLGGNRDFSLILVGHPYLWVKISLYISGSSGSHLWPRSSLFFGYKML